MPEVIVDDAASLQRFRANWLSPAVTLSAIEEWPVVFLNVPVGVGKSHHLDDLLDDLRNRQRFDVVIVLAELTRSLLERRLLQNPPDDVLRLKPRPREDCGPFDYLWRSYERAGCTAYAKKHLCQACPHFSLCFWPPQYGKGLKGITVIFGTHAHLRINPFFVQHIRMVTAAKTILLILDEAGFLESSFRTTLDRQQMSKFIGALQQARISDAIRSEWVYHTTLLTKATTSDLRTGDWKLSDLSLEEVVSIQEAGLAADPRFQWIGHKLRALTVSRIHQRWSDDCGVHFAVPPYLADRTLILSADMDRLYVERQLGIKQAFNPIPDVRIHHKDTRFYNLCCLHGAARRFPGNHKQILDVFAQLILRNVDRGLRTVLVSRKRLKKTCISYLTDRLSQWGRSITLIPCDGDLSRNPQPKIIPVIHYGISGVNSLEDFHAVYCLNSFYLDEDILRKAVADVEDDGLRFPVRINLNGVPRRRMAGTFDRRFRASNADRICRTYLRQLETNVVLQAVGRVRYATRPREVISFQASPIDGVPLSGEFSSIQEFRDHFGLLTGSEFTRNVHRQEARRLRREGLTTRQIAARLGVSERTVRYRLAETKGDVH